jgi:putative redox protein
MKAMIKQVEGLSLVGKGESNHWIAMDGLKSFGGAEAATKPMEFILLGLGGCTSMDSLSMLHKMRENVTDYQVEIDAERADEHPMVFTKIHLKFIYFGRDLNPNNVKKAIELSMTRYCSVTAMLEKSVDITYDFEIKEAD